MKWTVLRKAEHKLSDVEVKDHTPEGLFTKSGPTIAETLLSEASGDAGKAMQKLTFYINRAGDKVSNKGALEEAKKILHKKVEKNK